MKTTDVRFIDASLTELTVVEQREIVGGSAVTYWTGYAIGWTIGAVGAFIAAGTLAVRLLSDPGYTGEGEQEMA